MTISRVLSVTIRSQIKIKNKKIRVSINKFKLGAILQNGGGNVNFKNVILIPVVFKIPIMAHFKKYTLYSTVGYILSV